MALVAGTDSVSPIVRTGGAHILRLNARRGCLCGSEKYLGLFVGAQDSPWGGFKEPRFGALVGIHRSRVVLELGERLESRLLFLLGWDGVNPT